MNVSTSSNTSTISLHFLSIDSKIRNYFPGDALAQLFQSIDQHSEFFAAGVTFIMEQPGSEINLMTVMSKPETISKVLRPSCRADGKVIFIREVQYQKSVVENLNDAILRNESSLKSELAGVAWSCSGSAVGWVLVIAEAGGGSVSAGATWSAIPLTLSATSAATFQCGVAIGRTLNVLTGSADYNNWLDESPTFSALMVALDCLQIVDVVNTLGKQALLYRFLKNKGIGSGNVLKMFKELPRASRKRLAEEILKMDHPKLQKSRKMLKEVLRGQRLLEDGSRAVKVYSQSQVRMLMTTKFLEIIASGITIKGSGQNAQSVAANSISFVIGIGHN